MTRLQDVQKQATAEQERAVADLRIQGEQQSQQLAQARQQQEAQIAAQRLGTQAAAQSLRVLAGMSDQGRAPTAPMSRPEQQTKVRANAATQNLRIGSSGRGSGVGVNLGG